MSVRQVSKLANRVSTGIDGLDNLIQGGFPRSSCILLAGSPGAGKTIASAHYLYEGAKNLDENGIYVSYAEREEFFLDNMKKFGLDFGKLKSKNKFRFLDMITTREKALSTAFEVVLREVLVIGAKRLVIDSFSAMAQAYERKIDVRIVLHMLYKLMRKTGCTTLLLVEVPRGSEKLGLGFEEFVADGIIQFETVNEREGIRKRAVILKMRGTNHNQHYCNILISNKGISLTPYVTACMHGEAEESLEIKEEIRKLEARTVDLNKEIQEEKIIINHQNKLLAETRAEFVKIGDFQIWKDQVEQQILEEQDSFKEKLEWQQEAGRRKKFTINGEEKWLDLFEWQEALGISFEEAEEGWFKNKVKRKEKQKKRAEQTEVEEEKGASSELNDPNSDDYDPDLYEEMCGKK